jgi:ribosomal protein S18 acetylase RimI-like enzyme
VEFDWVEWLGYLASIVVLISLTMSSILKLRWINLLGCLLFAYFGYRVSSPPVLFANLGIAAINIYFLYKIYSTKEEFKIINASTDSEYYRHFLDVNSKDISKQIGINELKKEHTALYMLRDNNIAGVLVGEEDDEGALDIKLDYVIPRYRDYKLGQYYFHDHPEFFKERGITTLKTTATDETHRKYLEKVGFEQQRDDSNVYTKSI